MKSPRDAPPTVKNVGRYTVRGPASVNTWWIDAPDGLIVIDFQRDPASARQAIEAIRASRRPVHSLLLTHSHPDHIGGIAVFKEAFPQAPLFASAATTQEIRTDGQGYQALTREALGELAPDSYPLPDRGVAPGPIELAGLRLEVYELGAGESVSATVYRIVETGQTFSGDVVCNGMTDFLLEGRTAAWLEQLDELPKLVNADDTLFPGHGDSGRAATLIEEQAENLRFIRDRTREQILAGAWDGAVLSPDGVSAVVEAVESAYPDRPPVAAIPELMSLNVQAVAAELHRHGVSQEGDGGASS